MVDERELYQRFSSYDDEKLLRILTAESAQYRSEALAAAQMVLAGRGVATPTLYFAQGPPPAVAQAAPQGAPGARPQSPYELPDLFVDAFLVMLAVWGWQKLWAWTEAPYWVWPLDSVAYWGLTFAFLCSIYSLRQRWRSLS